MSDDDSSDDLPPIYLDCSPPPVSEREHRRSKRDEVRREPTKTLVDDVEPGRAEESESEAEADISLGVYSDGSTDSVNFLAAAVQELNEKPSTEKRNLQATDLCKKIIEELCDHDTTFLEEYLDVLLSRNDAKIETVTNSIMESLQHMLVSALGAGAGGGGSGGALEGGAVLAGWLSAAALWSRPRVQSAAPVLRALLPHITQRELVSVSRAWWAALEPEELVSLSDAARRPPPFSLAATFRAPRPSPRPSPRRRAERAPAPPPPPPLTPPAPPAPPTMSELLMRAALCKLVSPADEPDWSAGAVSLLEAETAVQGAWGALDSRARGTALALLARALALEPCARGAGPRAWEALPVSAQHSGRDPLQKKVHTSLSKMKLLFS